jgi:hypothetical protein
MQGYVTISMLSQQVVFNRIKYEACLWVLVVAKFLRFNVGRVIFVINSIYGLVKLLLN